MKLRELKNNFHGVINLSVILMFVIVFAGLVVIAYIIWTVEDQLITTETAAKVNSSIHNITAGFDSAVNLILVAITIFVLALAISALLLLRQRG
jgi:hypothetical protein